MRCALEGAAAIMMAAARVAQSMNAQSAVSTMRALATLGWQAASGGAAVVLGVVVCAPVSKPCDHQPAATHRDGARPP